MPSSSHWTEKRVALSTVAAVCIACAVVGTVCDLHPALIGASDARSSRDLGACFQPDGGLAGDCVSPGIMQLTAFSLALIITGILLVLQRGPNALIFRGIALVLSIAIPRIVLELLLRVAVVEGARDTFGAEFEMPGRCWMWGCTAPILMFTYCQLGEPHKRGEVFLTAPLAYVAAAGLSPALGGVAVAPALPMSARIVALALSFVFWVWITVVLVQRLVAAWPRGSAGYTLLGGGADAGRAKARGRGASDGSPERLPRRSVVAAPETAAAASSAKRRLQVQLLLQGLFLALYASPVVLWAVVRVVPVNGVADLAAFGAINVCIKLIWSISCAVHVYLVTQQERTEAVITELQERAALKASLLRYMAHEVRVPLTSVRLALDQLEADAKLRRRALRAAHRTGGAGDLPAGLPDPLGDPTLLRHLRLASNVMESSVTDALALERVEAGRMALETIPCLLLAHLSDTLDSLLPHAEAQHVFLHWYPRVAAAAATLPGSHGRGSDSGGVVAGDGAVAVGPQLLHPAALQQLICTLGPHAAAAAAAAGARAPASSVVATASSSPPPAAAWMAVQADAFHLGRVLSNFVSNAIKFSPPEGRVVVCFDQQQLPPMAYERRGTSGGGGGGGGSGVGGSRIAGARRHHPGTLRAAEMVRELAALLDAQGGGDGGCAVARDGSQRLSRSRSHHDAPPPAADLGDVRVHVRGHVDDEHAVEFTSLPPTAHTPTPPPRAGPRLLVTVVVADEGPGVPAAARGSLFQPFFQIQRAIMQRGGGSGLGLSLARSIVEQHEDAAIGMMNGPRGHGAAFFFAAVLPAAPPDAAVMPASCEQEAQERGSSDDEDGGEEGEGSVSAAPSSGVVPAGHAAAAVPLVGAAHAHPADAAGAGAQAQPPARAAGGSGRTPPAPLLPPLVTTPRLANGASRPLVLVVDDSASTRKLLCMRLRSKGVRTIDADSGAAALKLLRRRDILRAVAVVVHDLNMPSMNGAELAEAIRRLGTAPAAPGSARTPADADCPSPVLTVPKLFCMTGSSDERLRARVGGVVDAVLTKPLGDREVAMIAAEARSRLQACGAASASSAQQATPGADQRSPMHVFLPGALARVTPKAARRPAAQGF